MTPKEIDELAEKHSLAEIMEKYDLEVGDMPAFPQKNADIKKLAILIGEAKRNH